MATNKSLRTPIIKPRTTGGTFYTFASAMEDIGINIAEQNNKVSISHYVLLNLPEFEEKQSGSEIPSSNKGDYVFAENFQNYVLNMETVLRNQESYNFAANSTVSERVFWKWISSQTSFVPDSDDSQYYVEENTTEKPSIAKAFGLISASSQRSDDYGMYNETFVQIPSSYGRMKVLFKPYKDENYTKASYLSTSTNGNIENIGSDEIDASGNISATGITAKAQFDASGTDGKGKYVADSSTDYLKVEFDLTALREYYDDDDLTIDDIGMNKLSSEKMLDDSDSYMFNAILVYYSIYDSGSNKILATNAYGVYILDSTGSTMIAPSLEKKRSTATASGTSYSFRINIKTSSTYTSSIVINDNSTAAWSMSEDFNDVIKNLSNAVNIMKSNAACLSVIVDDNTSIKRLASNAIDKCNDLEATINAMKAERSYGEITAVDAYAGAVHVSEADDAYTEEVDSDDIDQILSAITPLADASGNVKISADDSSITSESAGTIYNTIVSDGYVNTGALIALLCAKVSELSKK